MSRFAERYPLSALARALPHTAVIDTMPVFHSRPVWLDFWAAMNEALLEADEAIEAATEARRKALALRNGAATVAIDRSCDPAESAHTRAHAHDDGPALPPLPVEQQPLWILKPSLANKGAEVTIVRSLAEVSSFVRTWRDVGQWVLQRYVERPLTLAGGRKFHARVYVLVNAAMEVFVFREALLLFAVERYRSSAPATPTATAAGAGAGASVGLGAGSGVADVGNLHAHITNTCVNVGHADFDESRFVKRLSDLPQLLIDEAAAEGKGEGEKEAAARLSSSAMPLLAAAPADVAAAASHVPSELLLAAHTSSAVYASICAVVADVFSALERETATYMPLESSFELYGADFLLEEEDGADAEAEAETASRAAGAAAGADAGTHARLRVPRVRVLEFNPTPDIKQTGSRLDYMIGALVEGTVAITVDSRFPPPSRDTTATAAADSASIVSGPRIVPRAVMREPPLAQIQQSYLHEWLRCYDAERKQGRQGTVADSSAGQRSSMLVWDRVLSLPPSAAASKGGMRCF